MYRLATIALRHGWTDRQTCRRHFACSSTIGWNKKAELSQRWPCDAPYVWGPENFQESL